MSRSIIRDLTKAGDLVLFHDYRAGHALDLSENSNDGTPTDAVWSHGQGVRFPDTTSEISVADAASTRLTTGTLVAFNSAGFLQSKDQANLISKRGSTGTNYQWMITTSSGTLEFYNGAALPSVSFSPNSKYLAVNFEASTTLDSYEDGIFSSAYSSTPNVTTSNQDTLIGNYYGGNYELKNGLSVAMIFNRALTATEHARLYGELSNMQWPTKPFTIYTDELFKTAYGPAITESLTADKIGASPFEVYSGAFKITSESIGGKISKLIECDTAGYFGISSSYFHQSPSEAAYGEWEFWFNKQASSSLSVSAGNSKDGEYGTTGYAVILDADEKIGLFKKGSSPSTLCNSAASQYSAGEWNRVTLTRDVADEFSLYLNGVLADSTGTGSNPVTDSTYTESTYLIIAMDAGDKIALSDFQGGSTLVKRK